MPPVVEKLGTAAADTSVRTGAGGAMTLAQLVRETLTEKHRRLRQEKCKHEDTYSSGCTGPTGSYTNVFCWDCEKSWHYARPNS